VNQFLSVRRGERLFIIFDARHGEHRYNIAALLIIKNR